MKSTRSSGMVVSLSLMSGSRPCLRYHGGTRLDGRRVENGELGFTFAGAIAERTDQRDFLRHHQLQVDRFWHAERAEDHDPPAAPNHPRAPRRRELVPIWTSDPTSPGGRGRRSRCAAVAVPTRRVASSMTWSHRLSRQPRAECGCGAAVIVTVAARSRARRAPHRARSCPRRAPTRCCRSTRRRAPLHGS